MLRRSAGAVAIAVLLVAGLPALADASPSVVEYSSGLQVAAGGASGSGPLTASRPGGIVAGPDGNLWFTDDGPVPAIGRITPSGQITEFSSGLEPGDASRPIAITAGSDGNLWFTDEGSTPAIGRISPAGQITEYSTGLQASGASCPTAIAAGPDRNVWFTDQGSQCGSDLGANMIGQITPSGQITEFAAGLQPHNLSNPTAITTGPDGNLWFTDDGAANLGTSAIGRITPSGQITEFPLGAKSLPTGIVAGPDGNLWFTDQGGARAIGQITPSGQITEYSSGLQSSNQSLPVSLAVAADGNIWFTDDGATPELGVITTGGAITENAITSVTGTSQPFAIAEGPDDNLWITDRGTGTIGRVVLGEAPAVTTGAASQVTQTGATVTGTVDPLGAAVSAISVQYGTTTGYGQSVATSPGTLPPGGTTATVTAAITDLPAGTTIHYRLVATNSAGTTNGPDATFTTQSAPVAPALPPVDGPLTRPAITQFTQSHARWRDGSALAKISSRPRPRPTRRRDAPVPVGTTFRFTLNEQASVTVAFARSAAGRRTRLGCQRLAAGNRRDRPCKLNVASGQIPLTGHQGVNVVGFDGRLSAASRLPAGTYVVRLTATAGGLPAASASLRFTVVAGR